MQKTVSDLLLEYDAMDAKQEFSAKITLISFNQHTRHLRHLEQFQAENPELDGYFG